MKKIKNYSNKFLMFEVVRLRTLFDNKPEIRDRIVKRYRLIVEEYNSRNLRWFWSSHVLDKLIKADWCSEAGGDWITDKGRHLCVNISEWDKVPEEIRDKVRTEARRHGKRVASRRFKEKKKRIESIVEEFQVEDRAELREGLKKYNLDDLNNVNIRPAYSDDEYRTIIGNDPNAFKGGGWFVPGSATRKSEVVLNPQLPSAATLDHEMGHMLYYEKYPDRGFSPEMSDMYYEDYGDFRNKVAYIIGDPYCKKDQREFCAEGFEMMMDRPNFTAMLMEDKLWAKKYFEQIMKDTGYKVKPGKKRGK